MRSWEKNAHLQPGSQDMQTIKGKGTGSMAFIFSKDNAIQSSQSIIFLNNFIVM